MAKKQSMDNVEIAQALRDTADSLEAKGAPSGAPADFKSVLKTLLELVIKLGPTVLDKL